MGSPDDPLLAGEKGEIDGRPSGDVGRELDGCGLYRLGESRCKFEAEESRLSKGRNSRLFASEGVGEGSRDGPVRWVDDSREGSASIVAYRAREGKNLAIGGSVLLGR